VGMSKLHAC